MSSQQPQGFSRFRSWFFPVYQHEFKLFLPLISIFFFICFNYNVLRIIKDSLVITAPSSGAEILPFMKVWVILPMALCMTVAFTRLSNKYSTEKVFYIMMTFFLSFFALFASVIYPLRDFLHPHQFANYLETLLPIGLKGFIAIIRNWTYTAFYVMAELWGTTIMTVLFWGFANEILDVKAAKRFYVLILIGGNLSAIFAGSLSTTVSSLATSWALSSNIDSWQYSLMMLNAVIIASGVILSLIFRWLHRNIIRTPLYQDQLPPDSGSPSIQMSLRNNFHYLTNSKYLLCIATIVLTYHISINLTEMIWKDQVQQLCPDPNDFCGYMGNVTTWVGIIATFIAVVTSFTIHRFSWTWNAMIAPLLLLVTGIIFFSFALMKNSSLGLAISAFFHTTPFAISILFGTMQQVISKASKYTIFDATKELAFIPLSKESKLKGKAAIDGVGSRLGKSGSALVYQGLIVFSGTVASTLPYVACILLLSVAAWMVAVFYLGKQFQALVYQNEGGSFSKAPQTLHSEAASG
ncbi:Npt1/Npt2 family nucleotide transporter [Rhabdochlamydiaceae symbiont of Dictyostelium giganteum]|uniref:Npt1/Npt2 family nucleotide transporter n=1 Tax=Rhabdochlamydiaceae symbiont of Dictyostelium giganteum TaxID=3342349 RepID=UPI00384CAF4E